MLFALVDIVMDEEDLLASKSRDPKRVLSTDFKSLSWVETKRLNPKGSTNLAKSLFSGY